MNNEALSRYAKLVSTMRKAQNAYFAKRKQGGDCGVEFAHAKTAEAAVDKNTKLILEATNQDLFNQPKTDAKTN